MIQKERKDISEQYKWRLQDIYPTDEAWEQEFNELKSQLNSIEQYKGKLGDKSQALEAMKLSDKLGLMVERLYVYAHCKHDENTVNDKYSTMYKKISTLANELSTKASFITPELSSLPEETLKQYINDKDFADYDYSFSQILKKKAHILSEDEEKLLAMAGDFADDFSDIFSMIDNADFVPPVLEIDGNKVEVTHGMYGVLLQNKDKNVRKQAYEAYYKEYKKVINTLAANYYANVKKDVFYSKARKYDSYLDKATAAEDVPKAVYEALIKAVNNGLKTLHEYIALRKRVLGGDYFMYDMYVPLVDKADLNLEFDEAAELIKEGLKPLGEDYQKLLHAAFSEGWIDVYETKNKRSGGYCIDVYDVHPYILLNYTKTTREVFTIAHELGHAMHSYYSAKAQPLAKARYEIFVAEVASTVNEMLLLEHLLNTANDENIKKYLLSYKLDMIRTTLFRQTQFAEFEKFAHDLVEQGEPLSQERLTKAYAEINARYYGPLVSYDDNIAIEWARIPHFYRSFYVYKYATGITSALNIADRILKGEQGFLEKYKTAFLSAGGSKSPYDIMKDLGIDLASEEPYQEAMNSFAETLRRLEKLI